MSESETQPQIPEAAEHLVTIDEVLARHPNTSPIPVLPQLSVALGLLALVFSVTFLGMNIKPTTTAQTPNDVRVETKLPAQTTEALPDIQPFENVRLEAKSAFVWDVQNQKILFNKNADDVRPLASITKLMTALVAYEILDPKARVSIPLTALKTEGDSGFSDGELFTVENLTDLTLIESSNDGAVALANRTGSQITEESDPENAFVHAMNVRAEELGLTHTTFENATGLDLNPEDPGAFGTAREVALLMEYLITTTPHVVEKTAESSLRIKNESGSTYLVENTNEVVNTMSGLIASKTGYTSLAGGNLVVAFNTGLNRPIIAVVLGSSHEGRFRDTQTLVQHAQKLVAQE